MTEQHYPLAPEIRVRREPFGLLFYNSKDTNLTFVKSGNLLNIKRLPGNKSILTAECNQIDEKKKIAHLIDVLLEKGFVVETRIDFQTTA
jgi:putative mycofactocin binding protein MftB